MITGILNLLINTQAISTLIGSRCYVNKAPQKAILPYIVLTQLNSEEFLSLDATTSTLRSIVAISAYGSVAIMVLSYPIKPRALPAPVNSVLSGCRNGHAYWVAAWRFNRSRARGHS